MKASGLQIREVYDVPLKEISGLGQRRPRAGGGVQVLAVGDQEFTVVIAELGPEGGRPEFYPVRLEEVIAPGDPSAGSEWEAADGDATGRVFILQESPGKVFVLGPDLDHLLCSIDLSIESGSSLDWFDTPNSQGEGLVLMTNGHLLVAKEKDPPVLMEFGPEGEDPEGVAPELLFTTSEEFPLPSGHRETFTLLEVWDLDSGADEAITDISDVAVGPDDRLYLLSDESRCIARIEPSLSPGRDKLGVTAVWRLPEELVQPEGLVLDRNLNPIVAIDRDEMKENLFVLSSLGS
jgi:hypothetical protein